MSDGVSQVRANEFAPGAVQTQSHDRKYTNKTNVLISLQSLRLVNNDFGALITHNQSFGALNSLLSLRSSGVSVLHQREERKLRIILKAKQKIKKIVGG